MKVCIITHSYPPDFGAAPFQYAHMAESLADDGHDVEVFTSLPNYPKGKIAIGYRKKLRVSESINGIPVIRHWTWASHNDNKWSRFLSMFSLTLSYFLSWGRMKSFKPDVIIVQSPPILQPLFAIWASRRLNSQLIINISDLWPSAIADLGLMDKKSKIFKFLHRLEKFYYKTADYTLAQCRETQLYIKSLGYKNPILYRIGVDSSLFKSKKRYGYKDKKFKLVYSGVLGVAHGILHLCEQINFAAIGCELHIYGDGFERSSIDNFIQKNPHNGIFLHDVVPYEKIAQLLPRYDASLISQRTSVRGTLPAKIYESMSAGLPIIFNGGGEGAKLIHQSQCGFVTNPEDISILSNTLLMIQAMKNSEREEMGQRGRIMAESFFQKHQSYAALAEILETMEEKNPVSKPTKVPTI